MREVTSKPVRTERSLHRDGGGTGSAAGLKTTILSIMRRTGSSGGSGWRGLVILLALLVVLFVVLVLVIPRVTPGARDRDISVDLDGAGPDLVLAEAAGIGVSSPIHPEDLTGLGYHPAGDNLLGMSPRGRDISGNFLLRFFEDTTTSEKIWYHLMAPAGRPGPRMGAMDVETGAGTAVYAPVTGKVVAIRPDPLLPDSANVVQIKPADNPDVFISVSLVKKIARGVGPKAPVRAGVTQLGSVADSRAFLQPQLSSYTSGDGNHVTVSASKAN